MSWGVQVPCFGMSFVVIPFKTDKLGKNSVQKKRWHPQVEI